MDRWKPGKADVIVTDNKGADSIWAIVAAGLVTVAGEIPVVRRSRDWGLLFPENQTMVREEIYHTLLEIEISTSLQLGVALPVKRTCFLKSFDRWLSPSAFRCCVLGRCWIAKWCFSSAMIHRPIMAWSVE